MSRDTSPGDLARAARAAGVSDERVLEAISATPRARYLPAGYRTAADRDEPIPIGHGQVSTQPSLSARMIEGLRLADGDHVLEIGTGLGFQTALLARLAASVISIERWPDLAGQARRNLARQGIRNAEVLAGDGSRGLADRARYDAILVSAAFPEVPAPLAAQLRIGDRVVQPIGPGGNEQVMLFERSPAGVQRRQVLTRARFVRLHRALRLPVPVPAGSWLPGRSGPRRRPGTRAMTRCPPAGGAPGRLPARNGSRPAELALEDADVLPGMVWFVFRRHSPEVVPFMAD